jgi:hypothetical protein
MSKRKQLITDILLNIMSQSNVTNALLLGAISPIITREEHDVCTSANKELISISAKLVERSKELDREGK